MAKNSKVSLTVDILGNATDLNDSLKAVQNNLSKLKLPTNISNNFNNLFTKLSKEIETFQSKASSTIRTTSDMRAIEKSGDKIIDLYRRLTMQVQNLNSLSDKQKAELIPSDSLNKMNKLQEGIKVYRSTVENLTKQEQKETAELKKQEDTLKRLKQTREQLKGEDTIPGKAARSIKEELDSAIDAYNKAQAKLQEINEKIERDLADPATKLKRNADGSLNKTSKLGKQYSEELAAAQNNVKATMANKTSAEEKFRSMPKTVSSHENDLKKNSKSIAETEAAINRIKESIAKIDVSAGTTQALEKLKQQLAGIDGIDVNTINSIEDLDKILQELGSDAASKASEKIKQLFNILEQGQSSTDGMQEDLRAVNQSFEEMIEQQSGIDNLKRSLASFFSISGLISVFRRAVNDAFQTVKELDAVMTQTAVVTEFDVGDMWSQLPTYTNMANELGATIQGSYETLTLFYQQGLKTNQAMQLGAETMKMARIANLDYATATDYMTAALRGFNMELNEASATRVNDVYSKLAAVTASDTREISIAMTKTASIANNANMELETTAALLSQIIETTREAPETAGTAMKTIIARFQELKKAPNEIGEVDGEVVDANKIEGALRSIGVALRDTEGQFRNLDDVFLEIASKWDSLDTNTQRYIATMAAGSRQQSRFIAMMSDYDRTMELVSAANNSAGASQEQFDKTLESMEAKLNRLRNAWDSFVMGLANSSMIKSLVDALTNVLDLLNKITDLLGSGTFFDFLTTLGLIIGTLKVGKKALGGLFATFEGVKKVFSKENISNNTEIGIRSALARVRSKIVDTFRGATAEGVSGGMSQSGTTNQNTPNGQPGNNNSADINLADQGILGKIANKVLKPFAGGQDITSENAAGALQKFNIAVLGSVAIIKGVQALSKHLIEKNIETAAERFEKLNNITSKVSSALSEVDNKLADISGDKETVKQNSFSIQAMNKNSPEYKRAVRQTNQIVRDMLQEIPEALNKEKAKYENGIWKVTEEFWDNYEDKLLKQQQKLEQLQQYLNVAAEQAQIENYMDSNFKTTSISANEKEQIKSGTARGTAIAGGAGAIGGYAAGSAVGGVVTALGGAEIGAAVGSWAPVVGTLIGAAIGALIGAAVGYASSHISATDGIGDEQLSEAAKIFGEHGYTLNADNIDNFKNDNITGEEEKILKELSEAGISFEDLSDAIDGNYSAFNSLANSVLLLEASQKQFRDSLVDSSEALKDAAPGTQDKVANFAKDMLTQDQIDQVEQERRESWKKLSEEQKAEYIRKGMDNNGATLQKGTESVWLDENNNEYSDVGKDEVGLSAYIQEGYEQAASGVIEAINKTGANTVEAIYNAFGKKKPTSEDNSSNEEGITNQYEQELLTRDLTYWEGTGGLGKGQQKLDIGKVNDWFTELKDTYDGLDTNALLKLVNKDSPEDLTLDDIQKIQEYLQGIAESDTIQGLRQQDDRTYNISDKIGDTEIGTLMAQIGEQKSNDGKEVGSGNQLANAINEWISGDRTEAEIDALRQAFNQNDFSSAEGIKTFLQQLQDLGVISNTEDQQWDFNELSNRIATSLQNNNVNFNRQGAGLAQVNEEATANNIDTQQLQQYADELQKVTEGLDKVQAAEMALDNMKLNEGLSEIISSYDQWSDLLDSTTGKLNTTTPEAAAAFNNLKKSTEKMLNVSGELSDEFFNNVENMEDLKKAANGDMEAIERLQKAAAKDILFGVDFDESSLKHEEETLLKMLNDFNPDDIKIGTTLDDSGMTDAFNALIKSSQITAEEASKALESIGYEPEITYETVKVDNNAKQRIKSEGGYYLPDGSFKKVSTDQEVNALTDSTVRLPVINGKSTKFRGSPSSTINTSNKNSSKGGGGGGSTKTYENKHDKRYNLVEDITEEQRTLNKLEAEYQDLLEGSNTSAEKLLKNYDKQVSSLEKQQKLNQKLLAYRKNDMNSLLSQNSKYSQYATYNKKDNTIEINWDKINKIKSSDKGEKVDEYISKLEEAQSRIEEVEDTLLDIKQTIKELGDEQVDAYISSLNQVKDALVEARQQQIDKLSKLNDTINDQNSRMFNAIQKSIDDERQARENDKTEQDIADKERRLAQLQMDTTGGNQTEILALQKEIDDAREGYGDSLVDQQLARMQEEADQAAEQRERQISLMEEQLDFYQDTGEVWRDIYDLWATGFTSKGKLDMGSPLGKLLMDTADYMAMSQEERNQTRNEWGELFGQGKAGQKLFLKNQENLDMAKELEAIEGKKKSSQSGIDYSQMNDSMRSTYKSQVVAEGKKRVKEGKASSAEKKKWGNTKNTTNTNNNSSNKNKSTSKLNQSAKGRISSITVNVNEDTPWYRESTEMLQRGINGLIADGFITGVAELEADGQFGKKTKAAVKALQKLVGADEDGRWGPASRNAFLASKYKAYATGGLADFTGPAWLDGTKAHPELVLNSRDTENFIQLKNVLADVLKRNNSNSSEKNGDNYYEIHIDVERIEDDYDVEQLATKLKSIIQQDAMYRNVNSINRLR